MPSVRESRGGRAADSPLVYFGTRGHRLELWWNPLRSRPETHIRATARRYRKPMDAAPSPVVGSLADLPGADLLRALARAETTGILRVGESAPTWAAFAEGRIVVAGATGGPKLSDELIATGRIDRSALEGVTASGAAGDLALLGQLAAGPVSDDLMKAVRDHSISAVFQMLLPSQEQFAFQPGSAMDASRSFAFPVDALIERAQERVLQWVEVARSVPSAQMVFLPRRLLDAGVEEVTVPVEQWRVLAVLDGRRTVAQVIAAVGVDGFTVLTALHNLVSAGLIEARSDHRSVRGPDR